MSAAATDRAATTDATKTTQELRPDFEEAVRASFWEALKTNNLSKIEGLIKEHGENLLRIDFGYNNTVTKAASYLSDSETMEFLLKNKCDPDDRTGHTSDETHWTALHKAAVDGNKRMIEVLLAANADPKLAWNGKTAMELAANGACANLISAAITTANVSSAENVSGAVQPSENADGNSDNKADGVTEDPAVVVPSAAAEPAALEGQATSATEASQVQEEVTKSTPSEATNIESGQTEGVASDIAAVADSSASHQSELQTSAGAHESAPGGSLTAIEPALGNETPTSAATPVANEVADEQKNVTPAVDVTAPAADVQMETDTAPTPTLTEANVVEPSAAVELTSGSDPAPMDTK